jgi:hypothetical protein
VQTQQIQKPVEAAKPNPGSRLQGNVIELLDSEDDAERPKPV